MTLITCDHKYFVARCAERCHNLGEASGCVVRTDGDLWTIDTSSPLYPAESRCPPGERRVVESVTKIIPKPPESQGGPGTELKKILSKIGINATPNCSCNARAKMMDENEKKDPGWCLKNIDTVVGWLKEEADKRGLPFIDYAGKVLVRKAVTNYYKAQSKELNQ